MFRPCQLHLPWMIFPMGCGGSRADAIIEPRYHESWTRETESTWLTNTDVETSLPVANSKSHTLHPLENATHYDQNSSSFITKNKILSKKATPNTTTSCQLPDIAVLYHLHHVLNVEKSQGMNLVVFQMITKDLNCCPKVKLWRRV